LERLGVEHIAAYSPQARGRSERVFHTLQDRLVKELALKEIDTVEAANLFLRDVYIPEYNARFAVAAAQEGTAFVAIPGVDLAEILCGKRQQGPTAPSYEFDLKRDPVASGLGVAVVLETGPASPLGRPPMRLVRALAGKPTARAV